jgi:hypothetical protein
VDLEITFHPDSKTKYEETITVKVTGGPDRVIRCTAKIGKANCILSHKIIDFDVVAIGQSKKQTLTIQNSGSSDAYFLCEIPKEFPELSIWPDQAWIRANASQELELVVKPSTKKLYDMPITIHVPGGKPLKCKARAKADVPIISIVQDEIQFGNVYVGGSASQKVTLSNTSIIPAIVSLDLSKSTDFSVSLDDPQQDRAQGGSEPKEDSTIMQKTDQGIWQLQVDAGKVRISY